MDRVMGKLRPRSDGDLRMSASFDPESSASGDG
jgi:hypothetical protein